MSFFRIFSVPKKYTGFFSATFFGIFGIITTKYLYNYLRRKPLNKQLVNSPPPPDPEDIYKEKAKQLFNQSCIKDINYNQNVDMCFYDRKLYESIMQVPNDLERIWKQRVLMESTPRGIVIMYFNAYKRGFEYFSDQSMPYVLINAIVMKYVLRYFCRDFFIDECESVEMSPLIDIYEKDAYQKKSEKVIDMKSGPFLKSKNYVQKNPVQSPASSQNIPVIKIGTQNFSNEPEKEYVKNRVIHMGKICNFSMLQKYNIPRPVKKKSTTTSEVKYSDFKSWRNPKTPVSDKTTTSFFCETL